MSDPQANPPVPGFPMNIVDEIHAAFVRLMPDHTVIDRPLRYADPARSIGIQVAETTPLANTQQIGQLEPTVERYQLRIQNLVKHSDEILGKAWFALDAKSIKAVLYRDTTLRLRLASLTEEVLGTRETVKQWGVTRQRFLSNELRSQFVYLATTDFWLETESITL